MYISRSSPSIEQSTVSSFIVPVSKSFSLNIRDSMTGFFEGGRLTKTWRQAILETYLQQNRSKYMIVLPPRYNERHQKYENIFRYIVMEGFFVNEVLTI